MTPMASWRGSQTILAAYNGLLASHLGYAVFGRALPAILFGLILTAKTYVLRDILASDTGGDGLAIVTHSAIIVYQVLVVAFLAVVCLLFIIRQPIRHGLTSLRWILIAVGGTFASTPLAFAPVALPNPALIVAAASLMAVGTALSLFALCHLGRCFGVSPQARGLVSSGPYRWLRHPIYTGEQVATLGVLLPVASPVTVAVYLLHCYLQFSRAMAEERVLTVAFPSYGSYARHVARFIPLVY